jgi:hypothetical protein
MGKRIAILTHARQGLDEDYFLAGIARAFWVPAGHSLLVHAGPQAPPPADIAFLHIDLTRVPDAYRRLPASYPTTVNGGVFDISKRRIADGLVGPDDGYDGPVVVKTDLNHSGVRERALRRAEGRWLSALRDRLPPRWRGEPPGGSYRIYDRASRVPSWVWRSRHLVVQRLFTERRGDEYVVHQWFFLGQASIVSSLRGSEPLLKWSNRTGLLPLHDEVPDEIRRKRVELGFGFGKFDFVVQDGRGWLLDANSTPHRGTTGPLTERQTQVFRCLAAGL